MAILRRTTVADISSFNLEKRTITVAMSSETPYLRSFGYEVLVHSKEAIDFTRMDCGAPVCWQHNTDAYPSGVVEGYELGDDRVLRVTVRFSQEEEGIKLMRLVADGIVRQVSTGYFPYEMRQVGELDGEPLFHVTKWGSFELSFVTVAADPTVGVGREIDKDAELLFTRAMEQFKKSKEEVVATTTQEAPATEAVEPTQEEIQPVEARVEDTPAEGSPNTAQADDDANPEQVRVKSLKALGSAFDAESLAEEFIQSGKTPDEFKSELEAKRSINIIIKKENNNMTYSLQKAIQLMHTGEQKGLEFDTSEQLREKFKDFQGNSRSIIIPNSAFRTQLMGVPTAGGNLQQPVHLDAEFVRPEHNATFMEKLGIRMLSGTTKMIISKASGSETFVWGTPGASNLRKDRETAALQKKTYETGSFELSPIRGGTFIEFSDQANMELSPSFENMMREDLAMTVESEKNRVMLYGNGINEPAGLNERAINAVQFAAAIPTRDELIDMRKAIAKGRGKPGKWVMSETMAHDLMKVAVGNNGRFLIEDDMKLLGIDVVTSDHVVDGEIWCGEWSNVFWADFGAIKLEYVADADLRLHGLNRYQISLFADTNVKYESRIVKGNA